MRPDTELVWYMMQRAISPAGVWPEQSGRKIIPEGAKTQAESGGYAVLAGYFEKRSYRYTPFREQVVVASATSMALDCGRWQGFYKRISRNGNSHIGWRDA